MSEYTADKVSELSGVSKEKLETLAKLYADPKTKVMSLWTMGFNQHVRGVWANHMVYNLHLLTGKISEPGNSPFSLTGQPSACGTAREVGTFSHRLPADMQVANPEHRKHAEHIWKLPEGLLSGKVGYHAVQQDRMLKDGKLNAYWIMCNNNLQTAPNTNNETYPGYRNPENFVVVSDAYPTVTAMAADLILPTAMWVEKEGAYGNAERRTHFWHQLVNAPGEARSDLWQLMEFSKRFTTDEVWPEEILAKAPEYRGKTLFDVLFANGEANKFPLSEHRPGLREPRRQALWLLRPEGPVRGIRRLRARPRPRPRAVRHLPPGARPALARGRRQGDALALPRGLRPLRREGSRAAVLRKPRQEGELHRGALRAAGRGAGQGVRPLARHRARPGALAFGLDDLAGARALQGLLRGRPVHAPGRRRQARPASRAGGADHLAAGRDPLAGRDAGPQQDAAGRRVRAVLRRQPADQQGDARRHRSDLEAERLQEMRREGRRRRWWRRTLARPGGAR